MIARNLNRVNCFLHQADIDRHCRRYPRVELVQPGRSRQRSAQRLVLPVDRFGICFRGRRLLGSEPALIGTPPDPEEIAAVVRLLEELANLDAYRVRPTNPAVHSYRLKHTFEAMLGTYISNGSAIVAMHQVGIAQSRHQLNTLAGLSAKFVRSLDAMKAVHHG